MARTTKATDADQTVNQSSEQTIDQASNGLPFAVEDATEFHSTRGRSAIPNPFESYVRESYETQTAKQVRVQPDQVDAVKSHLHRAAKALGYGIDVPVRAQPDGTVLVQFKARERHQQRTTNLG